MTDFVEILRQALALAPDEQAEIVARLSSSLLGHRRTGDSLDLSVRCDDITTVPADALVTGLMPSGEWGVRPDGEDPWDWAVVNPHSIDAAILRVAGGQYHYQALSLREAPPLMPLLAGRQQLHNGAFASVLFIVDDWECPLDELVTGLLRAADRAGLTSLAVPLLRTGAGIDHGASPAEKVCQLVSAVRDFRGTSLRRVHLVAATPEMEALALSALEGGRPALKVMLGDITRVKADAIILGINSEGVWSGGVDRAIYASSGQQFHQQARPLIGRPDESVVVARTLEPHDGAFSHVVFVADNLQAPLYRILLAGLRAADREGFRSVTVPAIRMGVLMAAGGPPGQKVLDMARAVLDFAGQARHVRQVSFVIYGDPITFEALRGALGLQCEPTEG